MKSNKDLYINTGLNIGDLNFLQNLRLLKIFDLQFSRNLLH